MKFTIFGTRGSYPICHPDQNDYGGNTSCHLFESENNTVIFDMGTGARLAGDHLMRGPFGRGEGKAHIFITHVMWDHIIGMPFFRPLYVEGNSFDIIAPKIKAMGIKDIFAGIYDLAYFPIPMKTLTAKINYQEIEEGHRIELKDDIQISSILLNHPGMTLGYRIDGKNFSLCYITDTSSWYHPLLSEKHEGLKTNIVSLRHKMHRELINFVKDSDYMLFDTYFSDDNISGREDWGHATPSYALHIAKKAGVKNLLLNHHDPAHSDKDLERMLAYTRTMADSALFVDLATEGRVIDLGSSRG